MVSRLIPNFDLKLPEVKGGEGERGRGEENK